MNKVLFVHDGPMLSNTEKTSYYGVHYTDEIVERYSYFGSQVSFLMRNVMVNEMDARSYTELKHPKFNFIEVPNFKSLKTILNKSKAEKIIEDAVITHDVIILRLPSAIGVIANHFAQKHKKPVLVEVVACVYDALWNYDLRGKLLAKFKMTAYRQIIWNSKFVIYVTQEFLQNRYPTKGWSIGCSDVVIDGFDDLVLEKRIQRKSCEDKLVLGTVAAIDVPYKGQSDVLEVLYRLKKKGINHFTYKIVGQGNATVLQKRIDQLGLNDSVQILGSIPHARIFEFFDNIDLYIQPSKQEGLPRAVIEAISRAVPVLATRIAGHPELVDKNCLFIPGNIDDLQLKLEQLNREDLKIWSLSNYKKSKEFKPEILDQRRLDFYKRFLESINKKGIS